MYNGLPLVPIARVGEHAWSEHRDLFIVFVTCPFCQCEHSHGPFICKAGIPIDDFSPSHVYGPVTANCCEEEYTVDVRNLQELIKGASE